MKSSISGALQTHSQDPVCAGPEPEVLIAQFLTPNELHYIRNHGPFPHVDPATYTLGVGGLVDHELHLTVGDLVDDFERHQVVTTLQCAGNRRAELDAVRHFENEVMWGGDAVGTAEWAGARLADVLRAAGVTSTASHVWFDGLDNVIVEGATTGFGASIDLARSLDEDVLLAYAMNGEDLPQEHGAPVRVVVPGAIGARSVKWLGRITVSDRPSDNHFQRVSYRLPTRGNTETWAPIRESHLNSFIATPADGSRVGARALRISGYAVPSGLNSIGGVEVSIDDADWQPAALLDPPTAGTWTRWEAAADLDPGEHQFRVRASDTSGAIQSGEPRDAWNPKGYANGAIQTVRVRAGAD